MKTHRQKSFAIAAALFATTSFVVAQSAYLPEPGTGQLSPNFLYFEYTDFFAGSDRDTRFQSPIKHYTIGLAADYGVSRRVAIDALIGFGYSTFRPQQDLDGLTDSSLGVRFGLVDEFASTSSFAPSLAVRAGAIIEGTYDTFNDGTWNGLGDGASGYEVSLLFGKVFGESGFGIYGDFGYRNRFESVPEDLFGSLGVYKSLSSGWVFRAGGRLIYALDGLDLFSEDFTLNDLPQAAERLFNIEVGIGYTDSREWLYQVFGARTLWGENTGDSTFIGASITIPFGRGPAADTLPKDFGKGGK